MVNPGAFLRVLKNSIVEQGQLRTEILEGNVGSRQAVPAHLSLMLVLRIDIVRCPNLVMNRGGESHEPVKELGAVPLGSLGDHREGVRFQLPCGIYKLHGTLATHGLDD